MIIYSLCDTSWYHLVDDELDWIWVTLASWGSSEYLHLETSVDVAAAALVAAAVDLICTLDLKLPNTRTVRNGQRQLFTSLIYPHNEGDEFHQSYRQFLSTNR
jgi:hypothetical protein